MAATKYLQAVDVLPLHLPLHKHSIESPAMAAKQQPADLSLKCVLPGADVLGETPLWCPVTQSLLWLDIDGGRLQRFHPATGRHDTFTFDGKFVGSLALMREPGRVLLGIDLGLFVFDLASGGIRLLCQVEPPE